MIAYFIVRTAVSLKVSNRFCFYFIPIPIQDQVSVECSQITHPNYLNNYEISWSFQYSSSPNLQSRKSSFSLFSIKMCFVASFIESSFSQLHYLTLKLED